MRRLRKRTWSWLSEPVTCREFAEAMFGLGQSRIEIVARLLAIGRWSRYAIIQATQRAARRLGIHVNAHWGMFTGKSPGMLARRALAKQPDLRPLYRKMRGNGYGVEEALAMLGFT